MSAQTKFAQITQITEGLPFTRIKITCNVLHALVDHSPKKSPKYRKVGKPTKDRLIEMVESGSSIVYASSKLGIKYSTAKSIVQTHNKFTSLHKPQTICCTDDSNTKEVHKTICSSEFNVLVEA